jgi:biotin transport system substrate-specific component
LLSAGLLGRRLSVVTQSSYILLGALGLPIFTGAASGLGYFISSTAGYLLGFIPAAIFASLYLKRAGNNPRLVLQVFCLASIIILSAGSIWLKISLRIPLTQALVIGFVPFIIGDFLKATAATFVYLKLKERFGKIL